MNIARNAEELLSLEGKVAVVSGGASGIGRGICLKLAQFGAKMAVLDIDEQGSADTVNSIEQSGGRSVAIRCDVRSSSSARQAIEKTVEAFGSIDILCNNAGIAIRKDVVALEESEWDNAIDVGLKGVYTLSHAAVPYMVARGGGSIVNTGSGWSLKGGPRAASYCAAKGGVLNLTRAMAIDHGPQNIRVNCVCPGDVPTPLFFSECEQLHEDRERFLKEAATRPLARLGTVEDVANAVLFLVSPMSAWITGTHIVVDGGGIA